MIFKIGNLIFWAFIALFFAVWLTFARQTPLNGDEILGIVGCSEKHLF